MPIEPSDIKFYLSGGASNSDPNASIGGAKSSTEIGPGLHNLFRKIIGDESSAGIVLYRCFYIENTHETLTWEAAKAWIRENTPSEDTVVAIGLSAQGMSEAATAIANETTAPATVTFSEPDNKGSGLALGDMGPGHYWGVWVRLTVDEDASAFNEDGCLLDAEGDTGA